MSSERAGTIGLCSALVAVGLLAWWLLLNPGLVVDASELATFPRQIGRWTSREVPLAQTVEAALRADFNLQRVYQSPSGEIAWVYIGYYGTARGGRPEHTPRFCYSGAGWGIRSSRFVDFGANPPFRVNEYLVERDGETRLLHFWYRSHRRTGMTGGFDQNLDRLMGRLGSFRADGALITVSTPLNGDGEVRSRSLLMGLVAELDPLVAERWPTEQPASSATD